MGTRTSSISKTDTTSREMPAATPKQTPAETLLAKPWRTVQWTDERKQQLKNDILNYKPELNTVGKARVLLVGAVGAGKSSFFNSINSAFRGNLTCQAIAGTAGKSVTTKFRTYSIKERKGGKMVPLVMCDTMGLEEKTDAGVDIDDIVNIFKGHTQDRYKFNPSAPLTEGDPGFKKKATLNDKIHCVVFVIDTSKASILSPKMLDKFTAIKQKANELDIPQILLMTKIDEACTLVNEDLKNVYRSVYIQKKAQELSVSIGIPLSCVLPVKNYSKEMDLDLDTDILLFSAMQQMLRYADSFFDNQNVENKIITSQKLFTMWKASPEPKRMFMDDPNIRWRTKRPDFSNVNKMYLEGKTRNHPEGSLEQTVENLVKTFEMEASHKTDPKDWGSVDPAKFELRTNGGKTYTLADVIEKGTYNLFLDEHPLYAAQDTSFEESMDLFKGCFPGGFAWELLDLYGEPPVVTFTWRHWSKYTGPYRGHPPTGETLELQGSAIVTVDKQLRITHLEMYFDTTPMLGKLNHIKCPLFK